MSDIAAIGDRESVLGFKALGYAVYAVDGPEEAGQVLRRLIRERAAIIFITEQLAQLLQTELRTAQGLAAPAIILIPGAAGTLGIGLQQLSSLVIKAVGMDILEEKSEDTV